MKTLKKSKKEFESNTPNSEYYFRAVRYEVTHERFIVPWQMEDSEIRNAK